MSKSMENRLVHLDLVRGLASLLVCGSHLRGFQFDPYGTNPAPHVVDMAFYLMTGFGYISVMIFFVLSGFFVAGSVETAIRSGRWSWSAYATKRLSRLWVVLIPALFLTLFWDRMSRAVLGASGYAAACQDWFGPGGPARGVWTFLGNTVFLQTIACPVYGSNGPLWSLANEFWYYALFPLAWLAVASRKRWPVRVLYGAAALGVTAMLPKWLFFGGAGWLLGFAAWTCLRIPWLTRLTTHPGFFAVAMMVLFPSLLIARWQPSVGGHFLVGAAFAACIPFLTRLTWAPDWYRKLSAWLSNISYTLYLVHYPVFAFLFLCFPSFHHGIPSPALYAQFFAWVGLILVYATGVWWLFERQTDRVRMAVDRARGIVPRPVQEVR